MPPDRVLFENEHAVVIRDGYPISPGHTLVVPKRHVAGQTVAHLHIHLIPRWEGDVPDPRGGIRWIFPEKPDYWTRGARG